MSLASLSTALLLSGTVAHTGFDYPHHRRLANGTISRPFGNVRIDVSEFSVKQVRNERYRPKSGLGAMLDVYAKYAAPLTPQLRKALQLNGGAARRHKSLSFSAIFLSLADVLTGNQQDNRPGPLRQILRRGLTTSSSARSV